jgi:hypothetical protein
VQFTFGLRLYFQQQSAFQIGALEPDFGSGMFGIGRGISAMDANQRLASAAY